MNMKIIIFLSVVAVAFATEAKCGDNQVNTTCGTACPLTCENYNRTSENCTKQCIIGCVCKEGYVKNCSGSCVRPEECPLYVCAENEVFNCCGTACPVTCANYENPPKICTRQCVRGCECIKGYFKNCDGKCVKREKCYKNNTCVGKADPGPCLALFPRWYYNEKTKQCENFTYGGCGGNGNRYCTEEECKKKCAEPCGENEVNTTCGSACPLACDNYNQTRENCTKPCINGCVCKEGYVRNCSGSCVKPEECPLYKCGANQTFNCCGTACPVTCANYENPPKICTRQCVRGCECMKGYFKNCDGKCVKREECYKNNTCVGEADPGPCKAAIPRWYYNEKTMQCEEFTYGGCGGNGNRYCTEEECKKKCAGKAA